jgi:hypothetical protein
MTVEEQAEEYRAARAAYSAAYAAVKDAEQAEEHARWRLKKAEQALLDAAASSFPKVQP